MRARTILLILAILLVAGFAALNWNEIVRTAPLSFGTTVADAPLGLILLSLLALMLIAFVVSAVMHRTQTLVESRHHYRTLESQRELAEKAEASRFTDLRQYMDAQLRELKQRDTLAATEFEKAMLQAHRELRAHMERMHRHISSRLDEFQARLDGRVLDTPRLDRPLPEERLARRAEPAIHDPVIHDPVIHDAVSEARVEPPPQVRHPL
jgi:hypothetical protein